MGSKVNKLVSHYSIIVLCLASLHFIPYFISIR